MGIESSRPNGSRTRGVDWKQAYGRLSAALNQNGRRCKDTRKFLVISLKVLWEKIRKYQIFDEEPETRESE